MMDLTWLLPLLGLAMLLVAYDMATPSYRPGCGECETHARRARAARAEARSDQDYLAHEVAHKGFGYKDGDPDRLRCMDDRCPRNRDVRTG